MSRFGIAGNSKQKNNQAWLVFGFSLLQTKLFSLLVSSILFLCLVIGRPETNKQGQGEAGIAAAVLALFPAAAAADGKVYTFVEMGANDGINSNTIWLEQQHGWKGLCIEAGPTNFAVLERNRPHCTNVHAVISNKVGTTVFREFPKGQLYGHSGMLDSRSTQEWQQLLEAHPNDAEYIDHNVETKTLKAIFEETNVKEIDYFSLDVEGAEMLILTEYPFELHPVKVWTIESNKIDRGKLTHFMEERGYRCWHYDRINTICEQKSE